MGGYLRAAGERLVEMRLNEKDQKEYKKYLKHLHEVASGNYNEMVDAQDLINQGIEKGAEQKEVEAVVGLNRIGLEKEKIAEALGITVERVNQIIENQVNK
jgi:phage gp36-like protein